MDKTYCTECHKNFARVKITRIIGGTVRELFLCEECAAKKSPYQPDVSLEKKVQNLQKVLSEILPKAKADQARVDISNEVVCPTCGLPYASYKETLMLGCSDCYTAFESLLIPDLNRLHRSVIHTGRKPDSSQVMVKETRSLTELEKRLRDAVVAEDFSAAIRLRDEIQKLK